MLEAKHRQLVVVWRYGYCASSRCCILEVRSGKRAVCGSTGVVQCCILKYAAGGVGVAGHSGPGAGQLIRGIKCQAFTILW